MKRALELAPNLSTAHAAMGSVNTEHRDWAGANREFQLAITLDPKDAQSRYFYGYTVLTPQLRFEEAVQEMQQALEVEPGLLTINANYGGLLTMARRYAEAKVQLDQALAMEPNLTIAHARLRGWYEIQGQFKNARQTAIPQFPQFLKVKSNQPKRNTGAGSSKWRGSAANLWERASRRGYGRN